MRGIGRITRGSSSTGWRGSSRGAEGGGGCGDGEWAGGGGAGQGVRAGDWSGSGAAQIASATANARVEYRVGAAEATGVESGVADLVTVAQAFHWFDHPAFFRERCGGYAGRTGGWRFGVTGWRPSRRRWTGQFTSIYEGMLGPYWEPERRLIETGYRTIEVPFQEIAAPEMKLELRWTLRRLVGYLGTWSPRKRYREAHGHDALEASFPTLEAAWGRRASGPITGRCRFARSASEIFFFF